MKSCLREGKGESSLRLGLSVLISFCILMLVLFVQTIMRTRACPLNCRRELRPVGLTWRTGFEQVIPWVCERNLGLKSATISLSWLSSSAVPLTDEMLLERICINRFDRCNLTKSLRDARRAVHEACNSLIMASRKIVCGLHTCMYALRVAAALLDFTWIRAADYCRRRERTRLKHRATFIEVNGKDDYGNHWLETIITPLKWS